MKTLTAFLAFVFVVAARAADAPVQRVTVWTGIWTIAFERSGRVHAQYGSLPGDGGYVPEGTVDFAALVKAISATPKKKQHRPQDRIQVVLHREGEAPATASTLTDSSFVEEILLGLETKWKQDPLGTRFGELRRRHPIVARTDERTTQTSVGNCRQTSFKGIRFKVYVARPHDIEVYWRNRTTGKPFRRFSKVQEAVASAGRKVVFMMNGGIFEPRGIPTGLHVEKGKRLRPLNLSDGEGNFYLKPNGVFLVTRKGKAMVLESKEYAQAGVKPWLALQSGPLLLRNGKVHPKFGRNSPNRRHRNGVGVNKDGQAVFVCTETGQRKYVTLYEFAEFFRQLGCEDALFLDGDLSTMLVDPKGTIHDGNEFGAILAITELAE